MPLPRPIVLRFPRTPPATPLAHPEKRFTLHGAPDHYLTFITSYERLKFIGQILSDTLPLYPLSSDRVGDSTIFPAHRARKYSNARDARKSYGNSPGFSSTGAISRFVNICRSQLSESRNATIILYNSNSFVFLSL